MPEARVTYKGLFVNSLMYHLCVSLKLTFWVEIVGPIELNLGKHGYKGVYRSKSGINH